VPAAEGTIPVESVKGIGPVRARALARLEIFTAEDALLLLPRRYEDRRPLPSVTVLRDGEPAALRGEVVSSRVFRGAGRRAFEAVVACPGGKITLRWFSFRGLAGSSLFAAGSALAFYGTPRRSGKTFTMLHPDVEKGGSPEATANFGRIVPVYPSVEGLSQRVLRTLMERLVEAALPEARDFLPPPLRKKLGLPGRTVSLRELHRPTGELPRSEPESLSTPWRRRLVFDELLLLQLGLMRKRSREQAEAKAFPLARKEKKLEEMKSRLPFTLTASQEHAYREIADDMLSPLPMQRLLQGDVGSGKTVVAAMACLLALENGCQAAVMAPTEILAEQNYRILKDLVSPLGVRTGILTGSREMEERNKTARALGRGEVDLVVGTHALIQAGVRFRRLGLAVIDEQHRFGVRQRISLREKGGRPDMLVMTATPIPRTLALTAFGDLDCTVIDGLPPGRKPVRTFIRGEDERPSVYAEVERELVEGRRAIVVLPLIDGTSGDDLRAAKAMHRHLRSAVFPGRAIGLVHGRMPAAEREKAMAAFRSGDLEVLVSTTVVEVGLDVPEAAAIIVEHPERFGLAQLHQLRGRVGRGSHLSRCYLMARPDTGEEAMQRLQVVATVSDGFRLAEEDLRLRGPGEFFGTRQSGLPRLRVADLSRDGDILHLARREAENLLRRDGNLEQGGHRLLREAVNAAWKGKYSLASAG
jgi:ATP-dependent DNA helicase RecG